MKSSIAIVIIAALVTASASLSSVFALDVSRVMSGELWRLFTCHFSHLTWAQYLWDSCAFALLFATFARSSSASMALRLSAFAAALVSISVMAAGLHQFYGGLSGISCALCAALIADQIRRQPRSLAPYAMLVALGAYLLRSVAVSSGVSLAHEAHVAGALAGLVFVLMKWYSGIRGLSAANGSGLRNAATRHAGLQSKMP